MSELRKDCKNYHSWHFNDGGECAICANYKLRETIGVLNMNLHGSKQKVDSLRTERDELKAEVARLLIENGTIFKGLHEAEAEVARLREAVDQLIKLYRLEYGNGNRGEKPDREFNLAEQVATEALSEGGE